MARTVGLRSHVARIVDGAGDGHAFGSRLVLCDTAKIIAENSRVAVGVGAAGEAAIGTGIGIRGGDSEARLAQQITLGVEAAKDVAKPGDAVVLRYVDDPLRGVGEIGAGD